MKKIYWSNGGDNTSSLGRSWIKPFINFDDIEIVLCMAMVKKLRLFNRNRTCIVVHTEERIDSNDERHVLTVEETRPPMVLAAKDVKAGRSMPCYLQEIQSAGQSVLYS